MNRALPEMPVPGNVAGDKAMEMILLERHRLGQVHPQLQQSCFSDLSLLPFLPGLDMGSGPEPSLTRPIKPDPGEGNNWVDFGIPKSGVTFEGSEIDSVGQVESCGYGAVNYSISRTASGSPLVVGEPKTKGRESLVSNQKLGLTAGKESSLKKRKAEMSPTTKGNAEEDSMSKRSKASGQEQEFKMTEQNSNQKESNANKHDKKNREASGCTTCKEDTKSTEAPKPDYIHVRARRGQATDSHSLAERVRREKISERMKCLQDLVPGCNKITGKAGMLDEIIYYVQSLQRQVEFLSMKLAAVNPRLDLNIDDLIAREVFSACSTSMPTMGTCQEMTNPNYLQYNPIQQMDPVCGSKATINPIDMGLRRNINAPGLVPETFIHPSCFSQIPSSLPWHTDLQNMYNMEFQQGRSTSFPLNIAGTVEPSNLKMEM